ncbi:MAG: SDR family NAD(P)-dependent oxidoreductase [Hydrogenophaga sp.]|uniref:SDR family NAD(P)-dependent oxidoreductase n=1 Tax=Hydrogenophaga sp. TaxID=1904254 RepID=UPI004036D20E
MASDALKGLSALKLALMARQLRESAEPVLRADPIAVVGMGCRTPGGVESPADLWELLRDGREAIREVPADRWDGDAWYSTDAAAPAKSLTKWGGFLDRIDGFDAAYFGVLPREAERMDPQQRLLLEVAIEALDDAGLSEAHLQGSRTGVYIASYHSDYAQMQHNDLAAVDARTLTGTLHSVVANRLSYLLDLRGPSLSIDTACSSSLVAIHLACQSLRSGESDLAVAGGVSLMISPELMVSLSKVGFMAPDGRCKTFDESADGFGRGEGCGVVVLKRLADAVADGDRVLGVLRGSAVNSDGHSTLLAAPNGLAQQAMVREALDNAQLEPHRIGFVEAHGTGTALGDPIEVEALAATVGQPAPGAGTCYIGAAKANIGHLEAGAGVVGLIKAVLALQHEAIPPQPNFTRLSHHISLAGTRLAVATALTPWPRGAQARCAAVSSFGVGGTNAHVIVEEAPALPAEPSPPGDGTGHLLPLSAKSPEALRAVAQRWAGFLTQGVVALPDAVFTAAERRTHHDVRLAVVGQSAQDIAARLNQFALGEDAPALASGQRSSIALPRVAFVFSGQGPQWHAMGRELLAGEPVFRAVMTECDALLRPLSGWSLLDALAADEAHSRLGETEVAQPALFALQVALVALWKSWGIQPDGLVGHSIGEMAALHVAGVLPLPDAIRVVWHRGRTMQQATGLGRMASVGLSAEAADEFVRPWNGQLSVAALNGPRSVVLSGDAKALDEALDQLTARGVAHRMLPVQYAFHSAQMAPFQQRLTDELAGLRCAAPGVPVYSTVTGALLDPQPLDVGYFGRNVRQTVRFAPAIQAMADDGFDVFLEIGPHPVLGASIAECLAGAEVEPRLLTSLRRGKPERETLLQACAGLYAAGLMPAWDALQPDGGQVVPLPAYPWQRKRHWIRPRPVSTPSVSTAQGAAVHPLLGRRLPMASQKMRIHEGDASASHAWLNDHRIFGRLLMPAAAMMDVLGAAARDLLRADAVRLTGFTLSRPLVIAEADEPATRWQVSATLDEGGAVDLELHQALDGDGWQPVANARAVAANGAEVADAVTTDHAVDASAVHQRFAELGVAFGPRFRVLQDVASGPGVASGWVELPDEGLATGHALHPVLLDGALQLCSVAAGHAGGGLPPSLYLPLGVDELLLRPARSRRLQVAARVVETGSSLTARVTLCEPDGTVVARLDGMRFAPADASALAAADASDGLLYDLAWQPQPLLAATADLQGRWLLLADRSGVADELADRLTQAGAQCVRVRPGDALDTAGPWRGVVHLWSLDTAPLDGPAEHDDDWLTVGSALALVQGLGAAPAPLWLVSRGAQAVSGQEAADALRPRAAGLWGLAGVVAVEHPELQVHAIDLDPTDTANAALNLLTELRQPPASPQRIALRGAQRWAARLVRHRRGEGARRSEPRHWVVAQAGTLDGARLQASTPHRLQAGEVRLRVRAAGINFRDVLLTLGMYSAPGVPLGAECAGEVTELGVGVEGLAVGDTVFGYAPGSLGTDVTVPAAFLAKLPAGMAVEDAAALPVAFLTAHHGLHRLAQLRPGQRVLIHAAAGGVGLAAVQLALRAGAQVFATAGSPDKRALLRRMGVAQVMDSRSLAFADELRAATNGQGVHVVLNSLAGDFIPATLGALGQGGTFLELGKRDILTVDSAAALRPDVRYHAYDLGSEAQADHGLLRPMFDDLLEAFADGSLAPLPVRIYPLEGAQEAFRFMAQAKHVGKIVLRVPQPAAIAADATYWITGGLGGLGLETARWLVASGARHLALSGRSAPGDHARAVIAELRASGATVNTFEADAADRERMASVLESLSRTMPPLRGVVHAAGALDDAVLLRQTWPRCQAVLRGKAHGAWVVHDLTRHLPLDLFVLYSAAGLWLGAAGQGAYPAANAELDALAHARHRQGLPALSVAWGAWAEVGMAAQSASSGHDAWAARGLGQITPATGFAALAQLLQEGTAHALVLPIDWTRFLAQLPAGADAGFFETLATAMPTTAPAAPPAGPAVLERLQAMPSGQRRAALIAYLSERTLQVLGLESAQPLQPRIALKEVGLDSLMAVELRNALAKAFAHPLPATLLFDYPTLDALATSLLRTLGLEVEAAPAQSFAAPAAAPPALDELADLSDEEAEALLLKELESGSSEHT